jgi:hypothetical protein
MNEAWVTMRVQELTNSGMDMGVAIAQAIQEGIARRKSAERMMTAG